MHTFLLCLLLSREIQGYRDEDTLHHYVCQKEETLDQKDEGHHTKDQQLLQHQK